MIYSKCLIFIFNIIFILMAVPSYAHGDLEARIKKVSKQIEKNPKDVSLYLKRGELYYQHEEYRKSIVDFEHALALGNKSNELSILRARSYFKAKKHSISLDILDDVLVTNSNHVEANRWKGKILASQAKYEAAAKALQLALQHSQKKLPDHYLELAATYQAQRNPSATHQACSVITNGIQELGPLLAFLNTLVTYHESVEEFGQAIAYQTKVIDASNRKEIPYYIRATLHAKNNSPSLAKKDLTSAQDAIEKLPRRLINSSAVVKLSNEISNLLSMLE